MNFFIKTTLGWGLLCVSLALPAQTIEACLTAAEANYPLIKQYDLLRMTADLTIENLGKGWLPQVTATSQASYQSDVASWPEGMGRLMEQMNVSVKGLRRDQYRVGIDIQQMIYDGGNIRSQQEIARKHAEVESEQTAVGLYEVRHRVLTMYFSVLMLDEQLRLCNDRLELLTANEEKIETLFNHGVAAECDWKAFRAERLAALQQRTDLESQRRQIKRMLELFCGIEDITPQLPATSPECISSIIGSNIVSETHPQLRLYASKLALADAQEHSLNVALRPRLGLFASGYYGYPGYNMFEDMMQHRWSLNGIIGVRLTWNIGGLYTRKTDKARINVQRQQAETDRNVFLFNSRMDIQRQNEEMARYSSMLNDDDEIIDLRQDVRKATESKLDHGIIDVAELIREINQESSARIQRAIHEIQMWKAFYEKKLTTNN
ncbi:MAG: TolC family protein [Bacteroidaceae bacterium]|nr:TolC family protein [Bacteroidaceae bacterium]